MFLDSNRKRGNSKLHGSKHSSYLVYSYFSYEFNFDLLPSLPNIWNYVATLMLIEFAIGLLNLNIAIIFVGNY
jgi:hypothetical protein